MQILKKILFLLSPQERKKAVLLLLMILMMALIDVIGVASILPFMSILVNPSLIETNFILINLFEFFKGFGIENNQQFIFVLGVLVFIILVSSLIFKAITAYFQVRFKEMVQYDMSKRLVEKYLHQPYEWFLNNNTAELGKTILSEISNVCSQGIRPLLELIARSIVSILLIILLFLTDPKLTLMISLLIGGIYYLIFFFSKKYLNLIGEENLQQNHLRYKSVIDAFGASKEVKVGGLEKNFIKNFSEPSKIFAVNKSFLGLVSSLPRFILEATAFGGIILIILYKMSQSGTFIDTIPIISLYVFAGYRLMPAAQLIYSSSTQIAFTSPSIEKLYTDINNLNPINFDQDKGVLPLNKVISLKNISYSYPNASRTALKNISLNISIKNTIGLVGATGSGKTTIVDIILGLLEAQKGTLEIDGIIINKHNSQSWQRSIGYVPQHIYLSDDTIASNIAFGQEPKDINEEEIQNASKIANLHDFVMNELPNQYETIIGERGVRLSGGQRQRIGIARALYFNPQVLILDEATSALDNLTEKYVMDAVNNLSKHKTIIMIAHRLSTVKKCDKIFLFEKGELKNEGTFDELLNINENFKKSVINWLKKLWRYDQAIIVNNYDKNNYNFLKKNFGYIFDTKRVFLKKKVSKILYKFNFMNKLPFVTIIIPYKNNLDYLFIALKSIFNQSYKNFKIVIVYDDKDKSDLYKIKNFFKSTATKRKLLFKIIVNKNSLGAGYARNAGIKESKSKYLAFLDSDDIWAKNKLKTQLNYMEKNNILFSHTSYHVINANNKIISSRLARKKIIFQDLIKTCDIGLSTVILKSSLLRKNKLLFPKIKTKEDYVLWLQIIKKIKTIRGLDIKLTYYRKTKGSLSSNKLLSLINGYKVYRNYMSYGVIKSLFYLFMLSINSLKKIIINHN